MSRIIVSILETKMGTMTVKGPTVRIATEYALQLKPAKTTL